MAREPFPVMLYLFTTEKVVLYACDDTTNVLVAQVLVTVSVDVLV